MGLFDKLFKRNKEQTEQKEALDEGLKKTKEGFFTKLTKAIAGKDKVDEEVLDEVEGVLPDQQQEGRRGQRRQT